MISFWKSWKNVKLHTDYISQTNVFLIQECLLMETSKLTEPYQLTIGHQGKCIKEVRPTQEIKESERPLLNEIRIFTHITTE